MRSDRERKRLDGRRRRNAGNNCQFVAITCKWVRSGPKPTRTRRLSAFDVATAVSVVRSISVTSSSYNIDFYNQLLRQRASKKDFTSATDRAIAPGVYVSEIRAKLVNSAGVGVYVERVACWMKLSHIVKRLP